MKFLLKKWIRKRLDNYKVNIVTPNPEVPEKLSGSKKVLVIGSGLGGVSAASALAARGFEVIIKDKNEYPGGKIGAWEKTFPDGYTTWIDHGFHAFFYQYYNLRIFLKKIGIVKHLKPVGDYMILTREGVGLGFKKIEKTPILNILSLAWHGLYNPFKMIHPRSEEMGELLKYNPDKTFEKYDDKSFEGFIERVKLPKNLELIFNSFSRAFFAEPHQMSMAELIKSFHYFYLSHDFGIEFDYLTTDYETGFLQPLTKYLAEQGVDLQLGSRVEQMALETDSIQVDGETYDYVVLATDVTGAKKLMDQSTAIEPAHIETKNKLGALRASNGYANLKVWIKGKMEKDWPSFVVTDRDKVLDSVTQFHLYEPEAIKWAKEHNGTVVELHSYSVVAAYFDEEKIRAQLLEEFYHFCPELKGAEITYENLQLEQNFTSFGLGLHAQRPTTKTTHPKLKLAGDWVKLPIPAMLMEGAYTSGLFAANEIFEQEGLRKEEILSVPLKGLMG